MKRYSMVAGAMAFAFCLSAVSASAQDTATELRNQRRVAVGQTEAGKLDKKTTGANVRASQLIGMNIQNDQGESVGEIKDLVVDGNTGRIRYAAVTYGGFLGMGNKMFAVPFEAFKVRQNPDDPTDRDDYVLILNVTQRQLEGAQGFDEDHWPSMADRNMLRELDERYGVERPMRNRDGGNVDINVNRDGVDVDVNRDRDN